MIIFLLRSRFKTFLTARKMSHSMPNVSHFIAVAQMTATNNKIQNMKIVSELVSKAASKGAQMIFLPEACDYIGESREETISLAESLSGSTVTSYCDLAKDSNIWLSVGGIHIKIMKEILKANMRKLICFDVHIPEQNVDLRESKYVEEGMHIHKPVSTPCGLVGLGICYDVRFPEFSIIQRQLGAQVLTFPSAFTVPTGLAHWHTLMKARAIVIIYKSNILSAFVVASAQTGRHNSKRSTYGHALIVDPWGTVIAEVSEGTNVAFAEIDLNYSEKLRKEMPVSNHRRKDLYSLAVKPTTPDPMLTDILTFPEPYVIYPFGGVSVPGSCIFLRTTSSIAFVNKKPFTDGHVLVIPQKPVAKFSQVNSREMSDLAQTVSLTLKVMLEKDNHSTVLIAIQDGENLLHVHVHLVPKHEKVFIEGHEEKDPKKWRDENDMEEEAKILRENTIQVTKCIQWLSSNKIPNVPFSGFCVDRFFLLHSVPSDQQLASVLEDSPILGHTYVFPHNRNANFNELTPEEVTELLFSLQEVRKASESFYKSSSATVFMVYSSKGQGVCAHVIPRMKEDLKSNDDIYEMLISHEIDVESKSQQELYQFLNDYFEKK
ncbi:Nitrilase and fragile histidine triad fusion protein NitFhit [Armadillidium nasatum]|uniref:Nitrilase and fragile histidine triad fusion protein NitFhit n=1 Tax=Armadillidium nasatum TaxID=96803 RepID=A0A5N5TPL2_9CRUS|nr:Nitrilase and fragile histidine triad fusion protein NitFhit [Armadillidium nasatum]